MSSRENHRVFTHVVHLSTFYEGGGGVERSIRELAEGLSNDYSENIESLCTHVGKGNTVKLMNCVQVTSVGGPFKVNGRPMAFRYPEEISKREDKLLHYHLPFPLGCASHLAAASKSTALATWHHDLNQYPVFNAMFAPLLDRFLDQMRIIVVTSPQAIETSDALQKRREKCRVVPLSVDERRLFAINANNVDSIKQRFPGPLVLFVGRLVYYKGVDVLIEAMAHTEATLLVVGDGALSETWRDLAAKSPAAKRIHFLGAVADDYLMDYYQAVDVVAFPSTIETEMFGLVQVEAMLAGKPIVNTSLPTGVPWVSRHSESGLTVKPNDSRQLADAINKLLNDEALRREMGAMGRKRALTEFSLKRHVADMEEIYSELRCMAQPRRV